MPIDLEAVSHAVRRLAAARRDGDPLHVGGVARALTTLADLDGPPDALADLTERRRAWFPVAQPAESPATHRRVERSAPDYTILATDGSYIDVDHHKPVHCYVLNVGLAAIRYGLEPSADLRSVSFLGYDPEDLYVVHNGRQVAVEGHRLNVKRQVAELAHLADLAEADASTAQTLVALVDGTLILSSLESHADAGPDPFLLDYLRHLDRLMMSGALLASYISQPRSSEVVGALRLHLCPLDECDGVCRLNAPDRARPCLEMARIWDRQAHAALEPGERSGLWRSLWPSSRQHYGDDHEVHFFYLNNGTETARVEVPAWLARQPALIDRLHAILLDQSGRGEGYPRALIEADAQAVITAADRGAFWALVDQELAPLGVSILASAKERAKRRRTL